LRNVMCTPLQSNCSNTQQRKTGASREGRVRRGGTGKHRNEAGVTTSSTCSTVEANQHTAHGNACANVQLLLSTRNTCLSVHPCARRQTYQVCYPAHLTGNGVTPGYAHVLYDKRKPGQHTDAVAPSTRGHPPPHPARPRRPPSPPGTAGTQTQGRSCCSPPP